MNDSLTLVGDSPGSLAWVLALAQGTLPGLSLSLLLAALPKPILLPKPTRPYLPAHRQRRRLARQRP